MLRSLRTIPFEVLAGEADKCHQDLSGATEDAIRAFADAKRTLIHSTLLGMVEKALTDAHDPTQLISTRSDLIGQACGLIEAARLVRMTL